MLSDALGDFVIASIGGIAIGYVVGRVMAEIVRVGWTTRRSRSSCRC